MGSGLAALQRELESIAAKFANGVKRTDVTDGRAGLYVHIAELENRLGPVELLVVFKRKVSPTRRLPWP